MVVLSFQKLDTYVFSEVPVLTPFQKVTPHAYPTTCPHPLPHMLNHLVIIELWLNLDIHVTITGNHHHGMHVEWYSN